MLGKQLLSWMDEHERTPGFLCRNSGLALDELIELITGVVVPDEAVLGRLAETTGLLPEQLQQQAADQAVGKREVDPLRCFTVKEVARLLQVSEDTIRAEMDSGVLGSITIGQRVKRVPVSALEQRLSAWREKPGGVTGCH